MTGTAHVVPEQQEILRYIHARHNTSKLLMRRSGLVERRVQRRIQELLAMGWIEQTEGNINNRVFGLTDAGRWNVPSAP